MTVPGPYQLAVLRHGQSEWNAAGDAIDAIRRIT